MKNKDFDTFIVCMNGMKLERTDCFKYLGVILDSNITWTQHISYIKFLKVLALYRKQDNI